MVALAAEEVSLAHWSARQVRSLEVRQYPQTVTFKPMGFWFDCDNDWKRWCQGEKFRPDGLTWRHTVTIRDWSRIVQLNNEQEIDDFTTGFGAPLSPLRDLPFEKWTCGINWPLVAEDHAGIVIAPYCWPRRMQYVWYYGWDCASGCVWDTSVVTLGPPRRGIRNSRIAKTKKK